MYGYQKQRICNAIIDKWAEEHSNDAMLAHTMDNLQHQLQLVRNLKFMHIVSYQVLKILKAVKIKAKFNGATGNYSAILTAFPNEDWQVLAKIC